MPGPISFTFTGRRRFMEILVPYLLRERKASGLAKHVWFVHTANQSDIDYAHELAAKHPDFFEVMDDNFRPRPSTSDMYYPKIYKHFNTPGQVYIKIDDDIVFIDKGALGKLANFKLANPQYFMCLANTINNGLCSHLHQRFGVLKAKDFFGWQADNNFYIMYKGGKEPKQSMWALHECFIAAHQAKNLAQYKFGPFLLSEKMVSINCFAVMGDDLLAIRDALDSVTYPGDTDEGFLSGKAPALLGKQNCFYGEALVSHYSFVGQKGIFNERPDLLESYKRICQEETASA